MFRHKLHTSRSWRTHFRWYLLSFLSGNVNAGGFLAVNRFVTHITGFTTLFGIDAALGKWDQAIGILSVPLFFIVGVMVSAYLVDRKKNTGKRPNYSLVMFLVFLCLMTVSLGGYFHFFGVFGHELKLKRDYFLLALLCTASGLQNAAISSASGSSVRTTHLTGIATDLGTGLVRAFSDREHYTSEMKAVNFRLFSIISFTLGSLTGAYIYLQIGFLGFFVPAFIALYSMIEALRAKLRLMRLKRIHSK